MIDVLADGWDAAIIDMVVEVLGMIGVVIDGLTDMMVGGAADMLTDVDIDLGTAPLVALDFVVSGSYTLDVLAVVNVFIGVLDGVFPGVNPNIFATAMTASEVGTPVPLE